jgi:hypothetical protein
MKTGQSYPRFLKAGIARVVVAALLLSWVAPLGLAGLALGNYTFTTAPAPSLSGAHLAQMAGGKSMAASLGSYAFVSAVGGVAFGGVASPEAGCSIAALHYRPERADGQRLEIDLTVAGRRQTVKALIFDWQLKPIAEFAATTDYACFTLFGELNDKADAAARRARGEDILNYHKAFENTLLGLRLMQADILILRPDACDLVKEDGKWLLGGGEKPPDVQANLARLRRVHDAERLFRGGPFRSYVICDEGSPVWF